MLLAIVACSPSPSVPTESGLAPVPTTPPADLWPQACDPTAWVPSPTGGPAIPAFELHSEVAGAAPAPFAVHLGWPSSDPSTSVAFTWRTDVDTLATAVEYGEGAALDRRIEGASFLYGGTVQGDGPYRVHDVRLCDALEPGTTYSYRVGGEVGWSPTFTFTTAPAPGEPVTVRLALAGDSRGSYDTWSEVVALMESHDPDLYLFSGDMVGLGVSQTEWDAWWAAPGDIFARKPMVPTHGNHEFLAQHYFAQMSLPGNEEWFGARWGDLTLVSLNDTVREFDLIAGAEADFLDAALAAAPDDWKIVMHHANEYAVCSTHGSNLVLREAWSPIYDEHGVQLVVSGHNHTYERSVPIAGEMAADPGEGTTYVVSGGAGSGVYTGVLPQWFNAVSAPIEHYVILDVSPTEIHGVARDLAGNVIDDFTLPR